MANQQDNSKEIDLTRISQHMRRYFSRVNTSFFDGILFIKRNIIIISLLVVTGVVLGYFMDKGSKSYNNKILVTPNFESVDYLYEEIDRLNSKIADGDTVSLAQLGIQNPKEISLIEIEPVVDIYGFIEEDKNNPYADQSARKYEIFDIIAEKGDVKKIVEDPTTSKNYKTHLITFRTRKPTTTKKVEEPLLKHLNANAYFKDVQEQYIKSLDAEIAVNDSTIKQIDGIITNFNSGAHTGGNLLYYNNNTQLDQLIRSKTVLLKQQEKNRVNKVNYTKIIKDNASLLNIRKISATTGKIKFILPILLVLVFISLVKFRDYYKRETAKRKVAVAQ